MVLTICIIIILIGALFGLGLYFFKIKDNSDSLIKEQRKLREAIKDIKTELVEIVEQEQLKRATQYNGTTEEIEKQLQEKEVELDRLKKQIEVEQHFIEREQERRTEELQLIAQKYAKEIEDLTKRETIDLQSITEFYESKKNTIVEQYNDFVAELKEKKEHLQTQLKQAENRQLEIIEQYKRAEQIRTEKDFYRIVLSEENIDDVQLLRKMSHDLHDPSVLYKLIYKNYYERPFNEMVGRVVTGEGSVGIYKITNLENGRCYIGQTKQSFKDRWRTHLKRGLKAEPGTSNKLYNAMWEDGVENFTFEVLAECNTDELNQKEKEYIQFYHADTWGYNSTGGNS